ncbi:hypothetical protein BG08_6493 (plasmid) [Bacillus thuringiensis serovar kurstaki]|uniref:Uncharacterized protein n=1 Tax=Bacillus cereus ISP2954 TaxID=1053215 RepID=A0A9W5QBD5_BACCE|nr:hypothetical protein DF16_pBMB293orf00091 [Bacillus thuringiensis serovar kurstaki str. YBT-1520]AJK38129.1 hypothetical protein BG08_6493 [Bacillus thuringiensis serovar kurstaki]EOP31802.1 hypothetical protein IGG_05683 [Bacillus cereus HuB13-1]EOP55681.1 hypothetical protein IGU_04941 [Bacillus cereus ISP2954]EOP88020.1 hypothetical protein IES_05277 [Bacillus cereus BMG1.7]KKB28307.1 hypothetical protein Btm27_04766 [Bacillus thuringiensis serovar mexicanensis]
MRKLFSSETHISVPYYLLWMKLNKTYSIVNLECKCQDKHVHFRLFKHVQNQSFSLLK